MNARSHARIAWSSLLACCAALLVLGIFAGCEEGPPKAADLSKTPWLDPNVQINSLNSSDKIIRGVSAYNLGNIGAPAADAVARLEQLAKDDPEPKVRENAAKAVEKIRAELGQDAPE